MEKNIFMILLVIIIICVIAILFEDQQLNF